MYWLLLFFPLIGALIGWLTNWLAITFLFHPRQRIEIPATGWGFQGLLPARQDELAEIIGQAVAGEILNGEELVKQSVTPAVKQQLAEQIVVAVRSRLETRIPVFVPTVLRERLVRWIEQETAHEVGQFLAGPLQDILTHLGRELDLAHLIRQRIETLDLDVFEAMMTGIARRELIHIQIWGAVLGAIIGLFQAGLSFWISA